MRIAYFDCFSGISGDMTLGAFLDAGLSMAALEKELAKLKVKGYALKRSRARRGALAGTKFDCVARHGHSHAHASLRGILAMIGRSALSPRVKSMSRDIFTVIGAAEAKVHGVRPGADVRLHELGELDSIVDIMGTAIAVDALGIDELHASPLTMGRTVIATHHGELPIPGPAAMELVKGIPVRIAPIDAELVTPTGAGIVKALARSFGPMPLATVSAVGYGAGSRDLAGVPNMLRVVIGERVGSLTEDTVTVIETAIDDMPPQHAAYASERLLAAGALDVCVTGVAMKKGRPGLMLTVLCAPSAAERVAAAIFRETPTIGVRCREERRYVLDRKVLRVKTRFGAVPVKVSSGPGAIRTATPEYEDCARLARARGVPLRSVIDAARAALPRDQGGLCDR